MGPESYDTSALARLWKVQPSSEEGYHRSYTTETEEGDLLQVDFNFPRQMVRISAKLASEAMREYVAVIKSGTILQEREVVGRRSLDLGYKFAPFLPYFSFLPDTALLKSIGGCYGIPQSNAFSDGQRRRLALPIYPERTSFSVFRFFREYLEQKRERELRPRPWWKRILRRLPAEVWDLGLGASLLWLFWSGHLNLTELAGYAGSLALFCGAWDWVWRQRQPFLPKVLALMLLSVWAVYFQVQNRMWAIFL